jgi:MFS family permease
MSTYESTVTISAPPTPDATLRHARKALLAVFLINGMVFASWMPQIPTIKTDLGLSPGMLGLALLGPAVGFLTGMRLAGRLTSRFGSAPMTRAFALIYCFCPIGPAFAVDAWTLFALLVPLGLTQGALIVASNAHGVTLQRGYGRPIMATFHAFYSMGGMTGAAFGGLAAQAGIQPLHHFAVTATIAVLLAIVTTRWLLPGAADASSARTGPTPGVAAASPATPRRWRIGGPTFVLSALGFIILMAEGETANWSAVYLREVTHAGPGLAAAGYVAFAAAMTIGRFAGDRLVARFGPVTMVRASAGLASMGLVLGLMVGGTAAGIVGFCTLGAGLSGIMPILFSAAGNQPGISAGRAIAQVAGLSFLGFLVGPPLMGAIADISDLRVGFALLAALIAVVSLAASATAPAAGMKGESR